MSVRTETESVAKILAALGNNTRLLLVKQLSKAETFAGLSITELAEDSGLTRQAITKHLDVLADAGLLSRQKPGRSTWNELKIEAVSNAIQVLEAIAKQHMRSKQRLKVIKGRILKRNS